MRLTNRKKKTTEKGLSAPALDKGRVASPALYIEEISPCHKKCRTSEKGKGKIGANIWADVETTLARANEIVTLDELKEISGVPSHDMVNCHVHKLVQVTFLCLLSSFFLLF